MPNCSDLMVRFYVDFHTQAGQVGVTLTRYGTRYQGSVDSQGHMELAQITGDERSVLGDGRPPGTSVRSVPLGEVRPRRSPVGPPGRTAKTGTRPGRLAFDGRHAGRSRTPGPVVWSGPTDRRRPGDLQGHLLHQPDAATIIDRSATPRKAIPSNSRPTSSSSSGTTAPTVKTPGGGQRQRPPVGGNNRPGRAWCLATTSWVRPSSCTGRAVLSSHGLNPYGPLQRPLTNPVPCVSSRN